MALSHFPGCLSSYCGTNRSFIYSIKFIHFILYYQTLNIIKIACYTETLMKDIHAIWKKAINFSLDISLESMMERRQEIRRVMCARWWNRNFQCSCSMETLILITTHAWEFHLGIQGLQQRGHSALLEEKKNLIINAPRIKRTVSLDPHFPSSKVTQLKVKRLLQPRDSPTGEGECGELPAFPAMWDPAYEAHPFLPRSEHWGDNRAQSLGTARSRKRGGSSQLLGYRTKQQSWLLTKCLVDSTRSLSC